MMSQSFLQKLQQQAKQQAPLNQHRWLPKSFDPVSSFIGNYPWQTLFVLSALTALLVEWLTKASWHLF